MGWAVSGRHGLWWSGLAGVFGNRLCRGSSEAVRLSRSLLMLLRDCFDVLGIRLIVVAAVVRRVTVSDGAHDAARTTHIVICMAAGALSCKGGGSACTHYALVIHSVEAACEGGG